MTNPNGYFIGDLWFVPALEAPPLNEHELARIAASFRNYRPQFLPAEATAYTIERIASQRIEPDIEDEP